MSDASGWTRERLAWVAGLFEGEGSIVCRTTTAKGKPYEQWTLQVASTDLDIIERLHEIVGFGHITGPTMGPMSTKPYWSWRVTKQWHTYATLIALYEWLGARRQEKARECIAALASKPVKWCEGGHVWRAATVKVRPVDGRATRVCAECCDSGVLSPRRVA